jgi:hypothetical protein
LVWTAKGDTEERRRKEWGNQLQDRGKKRRKKKREELQNIQEKEGKQGGAGEREWKEQVARVGTGYRVRKDEKDPSRRWFDVGYSDRKTYQRKPGREATVDASNTGRTVRGKGKDARIRVMNAVVQLEKRRRVSDYTGSGIRRKSRVGKRKLKPTKPQAKQ